MSARWVLLLLALGVTAGLASPCAAADPTSFQPSNPLIALNAFEGFNGGSAPLKLTSLAKFNFSAVVHATESAPAKDTLDFTSTILQHLPFTPVLGFDIARTFKIDKDFSVAPEAYFLYQAGDSTESLPFKYLDLLDSVDLGHHPDEIVHHTLQAGFGLAMKLAGEVTGRLSFDNDLQPGSHDHRALFSLKYKW